MSPALATVATSSKVLVASQPSTTGIDQTIRRNLGTLTIVSDQAAASELQIGAFGMIIVNDLALAAGAASIPGPVTDLDDAGWLVWVPLVRRGADVVGQPAETFIDFDSKAMRKLPSGYNIAAMVENASASFAFAFTGAWSTYLTRTR